MSRRFGSFPSFAADAPGNTGVSPAASTSTLPGGLVMADDTRLGGTVSDVPAGQKFLLPANRQHVAFTRVAVDGTLVLDGTLVMV